jgi:hypothetical protein
MLTNLWKNKKYLYLYRVEIHRSMKNLCKTSVVKLGLLTTTKTRLAPCRQNFSRKAKRSEAANS